MTTRIHPKMSARTIPKKKKKEEESTSGMNIGHVSRAEVEKSRRGARACIS